MHDQAGPGRSGRPRHLAAVPTGAQAPPAAPAAPGRIRLGLWQRMEAEDARQLLYQLAETDAADLAPVRLAFTLGRLHGAALDLLDIIDAITEQ